MRQTIIKLLMERLFYGYFLDYMVIKDIKVWSQNLFKILYIKNCLNKLIYIRKI